MKTKLFFPLIAFVILTSLSCSSDDSDPTPTTFEIVTQQSPWVFSHTEFVSFNSYVAHYDEEELEAAIIKIQNKYDKSYAGSELSFFDNYNGIWVSPEFCTTSKIDYCDISWRLYEGKNIGWSTRSVINKCHIDDSEDQVKLNWLHKNRSSNFLLSGEYQSINYDLHLVFH